VVHDVAWIAVLAAQLTNVVRLTCSSIVDLNDILHADEWLIERIDNGLDLGLGPNFTLVAGRDWLARMDSSCS
jgi:hypothetical protein